MRRRRLIGMYRVLLKSMNWCAPDNEDSGPRRSCRGDQALEETEQEPSPLATYLIGPSSTIDADRLDCVLPLPPEALLPLFLAMHFSYLGAQEASRNEARNHRFSRVGTLTMTTFDKREEAF